MAHKTKGLRIATRCTTMDQFVAAFHRFVNAQTVFISTLNPRSVGLETAFSIDLADNTPALRGIGVVIESWTTPQNPYGRPGLQLGIRRLTVDSEPVFDRLLFAREATAAIPTSSSSIMQVIVTKPGVARPLSKTQPAPLGVKVVSTPPGDPPVSDVQLPLPDDTRTPGSDLVLPANPLMNIDDKSLEGFVDCTLYEETGNFFGEQPVVEDPDDPVAAPPLLAPRRSPTAPIPIAQPDVPSLPSLAKQAIGTKPIPVINKLTPPMGASANATPSHFTLPMFGNGVAPANRVIPIEMLNTANQIAQQMSAITAAPPPGPPPLPDKPWVSAETAEMLDLEPDPSVVSPLPHPQQAPQQPPQQPIEYSEQTYPSYDQRAHAGSYDASPPPQHIAHAYPAPSYRPPAPQPFLSRRRAVIGVSAVATATIAIALIMASHSSTKPAAAAAAPLPTLVASNVNHARVAAPEHHPDQPVGDATGPATDDPTIVESTDSTIVGKGPCKIAISTTPAGSLISIDGQPVGPSPLTVAGPCEKRRIDIAHPRYAPVERIVMPKPSDAGEPVDVTLMRPTHNLFVETQPPGAIVSIDGHRAGTSPTMVKVMGFTTLTLTIEKPGWRPATKKLYSKTAVDRMSVKLGR
ncbi:MAG: PEGA domain-containing protein [Kofleriaceae bacterium]